MTRSCSRREFAILVALLGSGLPPPALAQTSRSAKVSKAAQQLAKQSGFSGSLLVMEAETVVVDTAFGFADFNSRVMNTPNSQFRIGSVTKPFTASLVLLLQQDGKIRLKDPVGKYLPDSPDAWRSGSVAAWFDAQTMRECESSEMAGIHYLQRDGSLME